MKIYFKSIKNDEVLNYEGDLKLLNSMNHSSLIKEFKEVTGPIKFNEANGVLIVEFDLVYTIKVTSMISFEDFDFRAKLQDTLYFTLSKELESDDIILVDDGFTIEEAIYTLILTELPTNIHQDGETYEESEEFHVYSEDELEEELEKDSESPFDVLKDLEF